jgi:hypothetical protein
MPQTIALIQIRENQPHLRQITVAQMIPLRYWVGGGFLGGGAAGGGLADGAPLGGGLPDGGLLGGGLLGDWLPGGA